jgi:hypothetical protein
VITASEGTESVSGPDEIADDNVRHSAITSHSIGVSELSVMLKAVEREAPLEAYRRATVDENVLGLATANGRLWRFNTLRRLYLLRPDSVLFRALRDLWSEEPEAQPLLAGLCALATDTVFRATAPRVLSTPKGEVVRAADLAEPVEAQFPSVYASSTMATITSKAYASWEQTGHLGAASGGAKPRARAACEPTAVAYALLLGHLRGVRGGVLFETLWARALDRPISHLLELAVTASQRGLLEFRHAGGVIDVTFHELLRPFGEEAR